MSSLGYSDFNDAGLGGVGDAPRRGAATASAGDDGYIAAKRKNKTVKSFDTAAATTTSTSAMGGGGGGGGGGTSVQPPFNPKLERLKQSIAKIHMASGSDDDDGDGYGDGGNGSSSTPPAKSRTNMLPSYPGQGMGQGVSVTAPPIADAGSGFTGSLPPTTAEGRTHQPMFSLSQQSAARTSGSGSGGGGGGGGGVEQFGMKMPSTYAAQYYKQFVPYNRMSNELSSAGTNSDELIEKLNYIVHMLEEQHNERTEHVAEELVLYCFLGVFIIFIVDSFARAGKYTR